MHKGNEAGNNELDEICLKSKKTILALPYQVTEYFDFSYLKKAIENLEVSYGKNRIITEMRVLTASMEGLQATSKGR